MTRDVVITALKGQGPTPADIHGIAISTGESFGGDSEVWDADLLSDALRLAQPSNNFRLDARITYVIPSEGVVATIRIEPRG